MSDLMLVISLPGKAADNQTYAENRRSQNADKVLKSLLTYCISITQKEMETTKVTLNYIRHSSYHGKDSLFRFLTIRERILKRFERHLWKVVWKFLLEL